MDNEKTVAARIMGGCLIIVAALLGGAYLTATVATSPINIAYVAGYGLFALGVTVGVAIPLINT